MKLIPAVLMTVLMVCLFSGSSWAQKKSSLILVDKKENMLHLAENSEVSYRIVKSYHATLGQVKGDKENEGDLKTPEGIYILTSLRKPPQLRKKFGIMAFPMDYPNAFDRIAGRTGHDIMLHATDNPERLKKNFDSEGCIVVRNEEITEILSHIRLGLTPILIFPELTEEYKTPLREQTMMKKAQEFLDSWLKSWSSESLDEYMDHYHSDFQAQGKNKKAWRTYKQSLNNHYATIQIHPEEILIYPHPKYTMITFTQNYRSTLKNGHVGHQSRGTKRLFIAEELGKQKIIAETYTTLMW